MCVKLSQLNCFSHTADISTHKCKSNEIAILVCFQLSFEGKGSNIVFYLYFCGLQILKGQKLPLPEGVGEI